MLSFEGSIGGSFERASSELWMLYGLRHGFDWALRRCELDSECILHDRQGLISLGTFDQVEQKAFTEVTRR